MYTWLILQCCERSGPGGTRGNSTQLNLPWHTTSTPGDDQAAELSAWAGGAATQANWLMFKDSGIPAGFLSWSSEELDRLIFKDVSATCTTGIASWPRARLTGATTLTTPAVGELQLPSIVAALPEPEPEGAPCRALLDRALGCMVGAAVGDAAGALLEWEGARKAVTSAQVGYLVASGLWIRMHACH